MNVLKQQETATIVQLVTSQWEWLVSHVMLEPFPQEEQTTAQLVTVHAKLAITLMELVLVVILDQDLIVLLLLALLAIYHLTHKEILLALIAMLLVSTVVRKVESANSAILDSNLTPQLWDATTVPPTPSTSTELEHAQTALDVRNAIPQQEHVLLVPIALDSTMEHV